MPLRHMPPRATPPCPARRHNTISHGFPDYLRVDERLVDLIHPGQVTQLTTRSLPLTTWSPPPDPAGAAAARSTPGRTRCPPGSPAGPPPPAPCTHSGTPARPPPDALDSAAPAQPAVATPSARRPRGLSPAPTRSRTALPPLAATGACGSCPPRCCARP